MLYITAHYHLYDLIKKLNLNLGSFFENHIKTNLVQYTKNTLVNELICSGGKGKICKKNADFIIKENEDLIIIEAKCTSPKNRDIFQQGKSASKPKIEKAVTQIMSSCALHKEGMSNSYGLIVTYKTFFLGANKMWLDSGRSWSNKIKEEMEISEFKFNHLFILSTEDFDTLVSFANDKGLLISQILKRIVTYRNNCKSYDFSDELYKVINDYNCIKI